MPLSAENLMHLGLPAPLAQQLLLQFGGGAQFNAHASSNATLAANIATGASVCVINTTAAGANAVTLRTATQMFNDIPGCLAGFTYIIEVYNTGNGTVTLTAPDGNTTITGPATIASNSRRTYIATFNTATTMTLQNISSSAGTDFTTVGTSQLFPLGARVTGPNGTVYMYGLAVVAAAQYDFVTVDASGNINGMMAANVLLGHQIGVAQVAIAASSYGWVAISGLSLSGNVSGVISSPVLPIAPSATTGKIFSTAAMTGLTQIQGIGLLTTGSGTLGVILTSPVVKLYGS